MNIKLIIHLRNYQKKRKHMTFENRNDMKITERSEGKYNGAKTRKHQGVASDSALKKCAPTYLDRKEKSSNQSTNVTFTMMILLSIFIFCQMPDFVASIIGALKIKVDTVAYQYFLGINAIMISLNSALNFYLYCLFYRRVRDTLAKILNISKSNKNIGDLYTVSNKKEINSLSINITPEESDRF